jgi:genome maintenance exonuclease 1
MHTHLENHILSQTRPTANTPIRRQVSDMADAVIGKGLSGLSEVWGIETMLYFPALYAGTSDLIGVHNGIPSIMDYKTTRKPKKREFIDGYFVQLAAYAAAHNEVHGTSIRRGVIFMISRNLEYQEFVLENSEFDKYLDEWHRRVSQFYGM